MATKPPLVSPGMNTGFLPIRAPVTLDDDDSSDFQSDGYVTYDSDSNASAENAFVRGDEFEIASDSPIGGESDEENRKDGCFIGKYRLSVPVVAVVADPSEESFRISVSGEEGGSVSDGYSPAVELDTPNSEPIWPIAQLSNSQSDEETQDDSAFIGKYRLSAPIGAVVADPSEESLENSVSGEDEGGVTDGYSPAVALDTPNSEPIRPIAQLSDSPIEGESDEETQNGSAFIGKYRLSVPGVAVVADPSEESFKISVSGEEEGSFSDDYSPAVELDIPNSAPIRPIAQLSMEDDFDELVDDLSEVEDDFRSSGVVKLSSYAEGVDSVRRGKVLDVEEGGKVESLVGGDSSVAYQSELLVARQDERSDSGGGHSEYLVVGEEVDCDGPKSGSDAKIFDAETLGGNSISHTLVNHVFEQLESGDSGKFEGKGGPEMVVELGSTAPEDTSIDDNVVPSNGIQAGLLDDGDFGGNFVGKGGAEIVVELGSIAPEDTSIDNAVPSTGIQVGSLDDGDLPGKFEADVLENGWQSTTSSSGIRDGSSGDSEKMEERKCLLSKKEVKDSIFGGSGTNKHMNESDEVLSSSHSESEVSHDQLDGNVIMELDEVKASGREKSELLLDAAALAALLKALTSAEQNGSGAFSPDRGAGSRHSVVTVRSDSPMYEAEDVVMDKLSKEERELLEKMQNIRVKFLRLVHRLGHSPEYPMVTEVLQRLVAPTKGIPSQEFSLGTAKMVAIQLEGEGKDDLDASLNILVLGRTGVGKSATINSIFGEEKVPINAFEPATTTVKEIVGSVCGVRIRIIDTPGLRSTVKEEATNLKILASVKKIMKKFPPDVVLYIDRLDIHARDFTDLPLLSLLTKTLTTSIWENAIITLTHATSPPPDGPSGSPLSFEMYAARRSHVVQQAISHAVGDPRLLHPSMRHPVSLVENHPSNLRNRNNEIILPDGESWRPQLLVLCFSLKILSEASCIANKPQASSGQKKLFGLRLCPSFLQYRCHPKLPSDQGGDKIDQDIELMIFSDANEEQDDYDQLPPFKPLWKSFLAGMNDDRREPITITISNSELNIALLSVLTVAMSIFRRIYPSSD